MYKENITEILFHFLLIKYIVNKNAQEIMYRNFFLYQFNSLD